MNTLYYIKIAKSGSMSSPGGAVFANSDDARLGQIELLTQKRGAGFPFCDFTARGASSWVRGSGGSADESFPWRHSAQTMEMDVESGERYADPGPDTGHDKGFSAGRLNLSHEVVIIPGVHLPLSPTQTAVRGELMKLRHKMGRWCRLFF